MAIWYRVESISTSKVQQHTFRRVQGSYGWADGMDGEGRGGEAGISGQKSGRVGGRW